MATLKRPLLSAVFFAAALMLASCGLGRDSSGDNQGGADPIVAATVNGRPIYREDVRTYAITRGWLQPTQDLTDDSAEFAMALEALVQARLFAMEAEARGHDRRTEIRRRIENAREWVLANSIYDEIETRATDPEAIERLYQDYVSRSGQNEEVHLRQIVFPTREAADQAKRRLDQGERFEVIAFEQNTSGDGGDLGFNALNDLRTAVRQEIESSTVGNLIGPIQLEDRWYIFHFVDRRTIGGESLATLRPRIIDWLRYREVAQLEERLSRDARIEVFNQREEGMEPSGEVTEPDDARPVPTTPTTPAPDVNAPPFPFPMGAGGAPPPNPVQQAPAPAAQQQRPPAQQPAQQQRPPAQQPAAQPAEQETTGGTE
ncbi:MAG: peptidylprolyl isomerase [Hyphomonadaceae bacterium]